MIALCQLAAEISYLILENPPHPIKYVNSIWTLDLEISLKKIKVQSKLKEIYINHPQRIKNTFITDYIRLKITSKEKVIGLNVCRLDWQVFFLSKIDNIKVIKLLGTRWKGGNRYTITQHYIGKIKIPYDTSC